MNRRIAVIMSVALVLVLILAGLIILWRDSDVSKLTVSFLNAEASYGPAFSNVECDRLAFAVRNDGRMPVPFVVSDIKDEHGVWVASFQKLDDADAGNDSPHNFSTLGREFLDAAKFAHEGFKSV